MRLVRCTVGGAGPGRDDHASLHILLIRVRVQWFDLALGHLKVRREEAGFEKDVSPVPIATRRQNGERRAGGGSRGTMRRRTTLETITSRIYVAPRLAFWIVLTHRGFGCQHLSPRDGLHGIRVLR